MIVICRFRLDESEGPTFTSQARAALDVLRDKPGFESGDLGRNLYDPELWTITTRWVNVGCYRRALRGFDVKTTAVPLLSRAIDEPTAYEDPSELAFPPPPEK
jgi:hypothetical protein